MTDIKPCPFCGEQPDIDTAGGTAVWPICSACENENTSKAVYRWNTRPREAKLEAEIAELHAQITDPRTVMMTRTRYEEYQAAKERLAAYEGQITAEEMREKCLKAADTKEPRCMVEDYNQNKNYQRMITVSAIHALSTKREEG